MMTPEGNALGPRQGGRRDDHAPQQACSSGQRRLRQQQLSCGKKKPRFGACPVCSRSFALFRLEDHVNHCLDSASTIISPPPSSLGASLHVPLNTHTLTHRAIPPGSPRASHPAVADSSSESFPRGALQCPNSASPNEHHLPSSITCNLVRSATETAGESLCGHGESRHRDAALPPTEMFVPSASSFLGETMMDEGEQCAVVEAERLFSGGSTCRDAGGRNPWAEVPNNGPARDGDADQQDMRDGQGRLPCRPPAGFKLFQKQVQSQARLCMLHKFSPSGPLQRKPTVTVLQPGMVLFRSWLDLEIQQKFVLESQSVAQLFHRFSTPGGGKYHVYSMCWGSNFDARVRRYMSKDGPELPPWMFELSQRLARDAQCHTAVYPSDSTFSPDVGLVNFYPAKADELGVIGLGGHQDLDSCVHMPVVSVSVGDSMTFFYRRLPPFSRRKSGVSIIVDEKDARSCKDGDAAHNRESSILLESGDVLVFGGQSRLVYHGTRNVQPGTRLPGLHMVPGRLNFTFRQTVSKIN